MTTILAPPTRSPGKLALLYRLGSIAHQASVNYIDGVDLNDINTIQIDADHLNDLVQAVLPSTFTTYGWKLLTPEGQTLYASSLNSPGPGTHGTNPGMPAYRSPTLKIMGKGAPTNVLTGSGRTSFMLFVSNAYNLVPGQQVNLSPDTQLQALMTDLNSYLRYWADFYGQHADTTGLVQVQFNAHEQARNGT